MSEDVIEEEGGGKLSTFKIILILLLLAGVGAALYLFVLKPEEQTVEEEQIVLRQGPPPLENPLYMDLGTFIINLQGGKYYLKATVQLQFADAAPKTWLEGRMPLVRDLLITQFAYLTPKMVVDPRAVEILKRDLRNHINSLFPNRAPWDDEKPVRKILFVEFYRQ